MFRTKMDPDAVIVAEKLRDVADRLDRGEVTRCFVVFREDDLGEHLSEDVMAGVGYDRSQVVGAVILGMASRPA